MVEPSTETGPQRGVLSGVRVLELAGQLSGPYGSMLLADMGADVIKVESPKSPDPARSVPSLEVGDETVYYLSLNRNKRSVALDLKHPAGYEAFLALVAVADVVIDNFRPGVTRRLRIDHDSLLEHNPSIITCSLTGFGETGPDRDRPGYDYVIQALSGTMSLTGDPEGPPTKYGISVVDHVGGLFAALGVTSALAARNADPERRGRHIDTALFDTHLSMLSYVAAGVLNGGPPPARLPMSAHPSLVPAQLFRTTDDYVVVMPLAAHFFPSLCRALGLEELAADPRFVDAPSRLAHRDELLDILGRRFAEGTTEEWMVALQQEGVPASPVNTVEDALAMDQAHARDMVIELSHPAYGPYRAIGNPLKFSGGGVDRLRGAPVLGEHTHEVLTELGGLSDEAVFALQREGAA